jgi:ketosteroid isomerase-like protein
MSDRDRANDEAAIRQLIDQGVGAIRRKDLDGVMALYSPAIVSFDIEPPLQYVHTKHWKQTFDAYEGRLDYEIRELSVTVGDDVAFSHSLNRVSGTIKNGHQTNFWLRWTACFRKIDGRWLITHDHVSVPIDFETGKASLDLEP